MKIAILGHSGSGKSTLARQLGEKYLGDMAYSENNLFTCTWSAENYDIFHFYLNIYIKYLCCVRN